MERLNKLRPMMIIVLISQLFFACANDQEEYLAENVNEEEVTEVYAEATIYYEKNGDKFAVVYHKNGDKKTFENGKKVGHTKEAAPDPITAPEDADSVEIIADNAWTDEQAIAETSTGDTTQETANDSQSISAEVQYWKDKFDEEWVNTSNKFDKEDAHAKSKSKNLNQEYYFLGYYVDALSSVWQATGDNKYLDEALVLINNTMDDATPVGNGFLGWPAADGKQYALWDSFYWRHVATLVRIMHDSPNLRSQKDYQAQYERMLQFSEKHIWDRYEADGADNMYRSRTHMASHWARIGMELYLVTGKAKYKTVFDNISHGEMYKFPSNLREQLQTNPNNPSALVWPAVWGASLSSNVQDTSHAGAIVSFWVLAYEQNMYWNRSDIDALAVTLDQVIWKDEYGSDFKKYVDGSGGYETPWRMHEWMTLGRFDQKIQNKLKTKYNTSENLRLYGSQPIGIGALNAKILEDGRPVYPEN